jgi:hypothetical protein
MTTNFLQKIINFILLRKNLEKQMMTFQASLFKSMWKVRIVAFSV